MNTAAQKRQDPYISSETRKSLLLNGKTFVPEDEAKKFIPAYAEIEGSEVRMQMQALKNANVFIEAFRDYFDLCLSNGSALFKTVPDRKEWKRHCDATRRKIKRTIRKHFREPNPQTIRKLAWGESAEYIFHKSMKRFARALPKDGPNKVSIFSAYDDSSQLHLGAGYTIFPLDCRNIVLRNQQKALHGTELDMLVNVGSDVKYFFDVSTSETVVQEKIDADPTGAEGKFMQFRESMLRLFTDAKGKEGLLSTAKIHVVMNQTGMHPLQVVQGNQHSASVLVLKLAAQEVVAQIATQTIEQLEQNGFLDMQNADNVIKTAALWK